MKFYPAKIFIALMLLTTVSCSEYNKLLKSGSNKQKYDKALEYFNAGKYSRSLTLFKDIEHIFSQSDQADTVAFYTISKPAPSNSTNSAGVSGEARSSKSRNTISPKGSTTCRRSPKTINRSRSRPCRPSANTWIGIPKAKNGTSCLKTWSNCVRSFTTKLS